MIECGSASGVASSCDLSSGVSTCSRTSAAVQPCVRPKNLFALATSIFFTSSARMCSCGNPSVCPVSWRTTRKNSLASVFIVKASRFMVGSPAGMLRMSVPSYDQ